MYHYLTFLFNSAASMPTALVRKRQAVMSARPSCLSFRRSSLADLGLHSKRPRLISMRRRLRFFPHDSNLTSILPQSVPSNTKRSSQSPPHALLRTYDLYTIVTGSSPEPLIVEIYRSRPRSTRRYRGADQSCTQHFCDGPCDQPATERIRPRT